MITLVLLVPLLGLVVSVDDTTMNLMAKVDPLPASSTSLNAKATSLIQGAAPASPRRPETHYPVEGIQSRAMTKMYEFSSRKNLLETRRIKVAPRIHLAEAASVASPTVVPEVLICALPAGKNGLSVRTCDMVAPSPALLSQVLRCSDRVHPSTVSDLLMGRQQAPIDLTVDSSKASASMLAMETPVSVDVSFPPCDSDRGNLPNLDTEQDYIAFIAINPDVERAAENVSLMKGAAASFRAGIVFVAIPKLFDDAINLKGIVASGFSGPIQDCLADGVCSASELIEWTQKGVGVDYLVGTSQGVVRLTGTSRQASV